MCGVGGTGEKAMDMRRSEKGGGKMTIFFYVKVIQLIPTS